MCIDRQSKGNCTTLFLLVHNYDFMLSLVYLLHWIVRNLIILYLFCISLLSIHCPVSVIHMINVDTSLTGLIFDALLYMYM